MIQFVISAEEDLQYIGIDGRYVLEGGTYHVGIGGATDCRANSSDPLCRSFELQLNADYNAVCEAACDLWEGGVCGDVVDQSTCTSHCNSEMWGWNYVDCLEEYIAGTCHCVHVCMITH